MEHKAVIYVTIVNTLVTFYDKVRKQINRILKYILIYVILQVECFSKTFYLPYLYKSYALRNDITNGSLIYMTSKF